MPINLYMQYKLVCFGNWKPNYNDKGKFGELLRTLQTDACIISISFDTFALFKNHYK